MNVTLWVVAVVLAVVYLGAGLMKVAVPYEKLIENPRTAWARDLSARSVRAIGTAELLGAIGLILPQATGIAEVLTPLAATGLAIVQVGAMIFHIRRNEIQMLPVNVVLLALAVFVAIGRFANWG
ncbi:DoxX family protein [Rhodococcus spongiicola]|uniref:DoxX family protein n=1 Tax=Rhodococcus spongiicola TaxID=2487352 RepID=A0A438B5P5_9NOCA|nr:DoxX family protein [Rhodococcus spongiicola]RVW06276.1 DoxX family protein [Rhodococcus spongiicola]